MIKKILLAAAIACMPHTITPFTMQQTMAAVQQYAQPAINYMQQKALPFLTPLAKKAAQHGPLTYFLWEYRPTDFNNLLKYRPFHTCYAMAAYSAYQQEPVAQAIAAFTLGCTWIENGIKNGFMPFFNIKTKVKTSWEENPATREWEEITVYDTEPTLNNIARKIGGITSVGLGAALLWYHGAYPDFNTPAKTLGVLRNFAATGTDFVITNMDKLKNFIK